MLCQSARSGRAAGFAHLRHYDSKSLLDFIVRARQPPWSARGPGGELAGGLPGEEQTSGPFRD